MKVTTKSKYGTRLLLDIAINGQRGLVRTGDIAERQDLSKKYLEKLIRELKKTGFIESKRGPGGGHQLNRAAGEIRVGQIVQALDGDYPLLECGEECEGCPRAAVCLNRTIWDEARLAMYKTLNSFTLADLIRDVDLCPLS